MRSHLEFRHSVDLSPSCREHRRTNLRNPSGNDHFELKSVPKLPALPILEQLGSSSASYEG